LTFALGARGWWAANVKSVPLAGWSQPVAKSPAADIKIVDARMHETTGPCEALRLGITGAGRNGNPLMRVPTSLATEDREHQADSKLTPILKAN
jgi:hypothetical protein